MATSRALSKQVEEERDSIAKIAFGIIVALCVQILVYLLLINVVPVSIKEPILEQDGYKVYNYDDVNGLYKEEWATYIGYDINGDGKIGTYVKNVQAGDELKSLTFSEWGAFPTKDGMKATFSSDKKVDNGMQFIFGYNMVLLVGTVILSGWYLLTVMEEKSGFVIASCKEFFIKNKALMFLLFFMIWAFISSILALDKHRSFVGCYNLRDGYFSFMFYASMLINVLLLGKNKAAEKKKIVNIFLITATTLASLVLINYYVALGGHSMWPTVKRSVVLGQEVQITNDETIYPVFVAGASAGNILTGIFNNTNHYAYYLSIAVIVAAVMAIRTPEIYKKVLYLLSFMVLTFILILNDTFGSYLGVLISLVCMLVYQVVMIIISDKESAKENLSRTIITIGTFLIFIALSLSIENAKGEIIAAKNFKDTSDGISSIITSLNKNDEIQTESNSTNNASTENASTSTSQNNLQDSDVDASEAGSGRWGIWLNSFKVIKRFPIFGCGPENMLYRMDEIVRTEGTGSVEGRSHNLIIQLSATTGIPGMLLYFIGMAIIFCKLLKRVRKWDTFTCMSFFVMISYLISSMTGNSGFYTSGYFYIFVGFAIVGVWEIIDKEAEMKTTNIKSVVVNKSIIEETEKRKHKKQK